MLLRAKSEFCFKMVFIKSAVTFLVCLVVCEGTKLPSYFSQCKKDDPNIEKCILDSANAGMSSFVKGDTSVHVIKLDPLHVPVLYIDVGGNLKINLTDSDIYGLKSAKLTHAAIDFEKKTMDWTLHLDEVNLIGFYDIHGRILILPINGNGPCNMTFVDANYHAHYEFEIKERHNKEYIHLIKHSLNYDTKRAYFKLDNLFDGNKQLGEEMNKFLDENWKEVNEEVGARVGDALSEIFTSILNQFYGKVAVSDLFG